MKPQKIYILTFLSGVLLLLCLSQCSKKDEDNDLAVFPKFNISPQSGTTQTTFTFDSTPTTWNGYTPEVQFQFNYDWDFGDGTTKLHADNIETHQYTDPGQYKVTLTVTLTNLSTNETVNESYSDNLTVQ